LLFFTLRLTGNFIDDTLKRFRFDRFGHIIIHARIDALFPIPRHGMSRHGDDWNP
jgi:hypothetical protein